MPAGFRTYCALSDGGMLECDGIADALRRGMRSLLVVVAFAAACAASGSDTRSAPSASRQSTDSVDALIKGDYATALALAERGLKSHPDDAWLAYDKGVAQAGLGHLDAALETLRAAASRFTDAHNRSLAAYRRALALELAGRCAEASTEFSHYAALMRGELPMLADEALAHLEYCITPTPQQTAERQQAEALQIVAGSAKLRQVEQASTDSVTAMVTTDYQTALAKAEAGLTIVPDDPWLLYNKGTALVGLGRTDDGLATLRQAERRFSESNIHGRSVAAYRRAMALEVAGRCDEEKAELDHFAALTQPADPDFVRHALAHVKFCKLANASSKTIF